MEYLMARDAISLYPYNLSLAEEIVRLFSTPEPSVVVKNNKSDDDADDDFARNGKDVEYCPEESVNNNKKKKKKLSRECGFCKNNGEDAQYYRSHCLRDERGKVLCPVLRAYKCPICNNEGGDLAHTIGYCPMNKSPEKIPVVISLKTQRTSAGKKKN
ncbi:nanos homolog 1-like [Centruroides sculpturatus]|uniref:nanos homolog 1-like n=1 Tax=Centruroides sculpturatus TaxID=218467 RepID=UPI000C6D3677|nr:nanos homolog 1-like [Centruroides sculpturatus]